MGKDRPPKPPASSSAAAGASSNDSKKPSGAATAGAGAGPTAPGEKKPPIARGHRQRGAGTVTVGKPAQVTEDGVVIKPHERLPSTLLREYCQKEKRPLPQYRQIGPGDRVQVVLPDARNSKNDLTFTPPAQDFESAKVANDAAALLALWHFQKTLPLERKLPEPYSSTWLRLIAESKEPTAAGSANSSSSSSSSGASSSSSNSSLKASPSPVTATAATATIATAIATPVATLSSSISAPAPTRPATTASLKPAATSASPSLASSSSSRPSPPAFSVHLTDNSRERKDAEERAQERKRRKTYFDTLKLANKLNKVFLSAKLKREIERVLLQAGDRCDDNGTSNNSNVENHAQLMRACGVTVDNYQDKWKELLDSVGKQGIVKGNADFASFEKMLTPTLQQRALQKHVLPQLQQQGFHLYSIVEGAYAVLQIQATKLFDEVQALIDNTTSTTLLTDARLCETFAASVCESVLEYLCLHLDEEDLPQHMDGRAQESCRTLEVVNTSSKLQQRIHSPAVSQTQSDSATDWNESTAVDDVIVALLDEQDQICVQQLLPGWGLFLSTAAVHYARCVFQSASASEQHRDNEFQCVYVTALAQVLLMAATYQSTHITNTPAETHMKELFAEFVAAIRTQSDSQSHAQQKEMVATEMETLSAIFVDDEVLRTYQPTPYSTCIHVLTTSAAAILHATIFSALPYPQHPPLCVLASSSSSSSVDKNKDRFQPALAQAAAELFAYSFQLKDEFMMYSLSLHSSDLLAAAEDGNADAQSQQRKIHALMCKILTSWQQDLALTWNEGFVPTMTSSGDVTHDIDVVPTIAEGSTSQSPALENEEEGNVGSVTAATTTSGAPAGRGQSYTHPFWIRSNKAPQRASQKQQQQQNNSQQAFKMLELRKKLPAWNSKSELVALLENRQSIVITGETGCGKTTQVPQFIHEQWPAAKIVVCQPRRLAAVGVASRVAEEMLCPLSSSNGGSVGNVGYMVRGDTRASAQTHILFVTYGVILRRLQEDPDLDSVDFIILDEVHERGIESDFALSLLMQAVKNRRRSSQPLSLILMSATISTDKFAAYLGTANSISSAPSSGSELAPIVHIPGFTFPVQQYYKQQFETLLRHQQFAFLSATSVQSSAGGDVDDEDDNSSRRGRFSFSSFEEWDTYRKQLQSKRASTSSNMDFIDYDLIIQLLCRLGFGDVFRTDEAAMAMYAQTTTQAQNPLTNHQVAQMASSCVGGCVLVFMPGVPEINKCMNQLQTVWDKFATMASRGHSKAPKLRLCGLHGNLSPAEQKAVFVPALPHELKIVVSTNVAEASVTLSDVVCVVDTCRVKELEFDPDTHTSALITKLASRDSLRQRSGRAGRVCEGRAFRLITESTHTHKLQQHSIPEILRAPLDRLVLQLKATEAASTNMQPMPFEEYLARIDSSSSSSTNHLNCVWSVLSNCIDPPSSFSIQTSIKRLQTLQALQPSTESEALTPLGKHLSQIPTDPKLARLLVYGVMLGCVFDCACVCALASVKSPFMTSMDMRAQIDQVKSTLATKSGIRSDPLAVVQAMKGFVGLKGMSAQRK